MEGGWPFIAIIISLALALLSAMAPVILSLYVGASKARRQSFSNGPMGLSGRRRKPFPHAILCVRDYKSIEEVSPPFHRSTEVMAYSNEEEEK